MNDDVEQRGSRIFHDVNNAFKKDPHIDEYDIIPMFEAEYNRSPVVLINHKLGLEMWAVPILYQYAYRQIMKYRETLDQEMTISLSGIVLMINADCYTVWNVRKTLVCERKLDPIKDLNLASLILRKHPKSPETFSHRKWLLKQITQLELTSPVQQIDNLKSNVTASNCDRYSQYSKLIEDEMEICRITAEKLACNYNAWSHRIWTVQHIAGCSLALLLSELKATKTWVSSNISDHSGFHYRQFLLQNVFQCHDSAKNDVPSDIKLIEEELDFTTELINSYSSHEAIWYHRRFIIHLLHSSYIQQSSTTEQKVVKKTKLDSDGRVRVLQGEQEFINKHMKNKLCQNYQEWSKHTRFYASS